MVELGGCSRTVLAAFGVGALGRRIPRLGLGQPGVQVVPGPVATRQELGQEPTDLRARGAQSTRDRPRQNIEKGVWA